MDRPCGGMHVLMRYWMILGVIVCCVTVLHAQECSQGCPAGHYEAKPCTHFGDRVCKPCKKCDGSMYEASPCTQHADRTCIHAAHPLLISGEETTSTFLDELTQRKPARKKRKRLKVDASPNVVVEDLHNTRNLETTFYVTDTTQASDFPWIRESGIQVNIGILDVHLIPEYEDVDHRSDNSYMTNNPNQDQDKADFSAIVKNHCRNPIPDSYSITLEVARDRMTTARMVECSNQNPALPDCPTGHVDGDVILQRDLNSPCTQMGTFPKELDVHRNSIVCTKSDALLHDIFGRSSTMEHTITFPDKKCKVAQTRCDQCFEHTACERADIFDSQCCKVDCYTLADCKVARSAQCQRFPVECAMGDAYRYTLQPVFDDLSNEFHCHLKHKKPRILYELFFYLELPDRYETPRVSKTIYAEDLDYQSQGQFQADFLTIEHSVGLNLADEFILHGRDWAADRSNYSVAALKTERDYAAQQNQRVTVYDVDHNIYVASAQFARPFDYSSETWTINNNCEKDISKFVPAQKHSNDVTSQNVKVTTDSVSSPFKYHIQPQDKSPFIRFTAPGNMSLLPWYFDDDGPELLIDDSLDVQLELQPGHRVWNIHVTGRMSDCPAYLGVTINTREDMEELIRHDLLIMCPTTFNLTFHAPNIGAQPSKTFDVIFKDSRKTYQVFLTQLDVGEKLEALPPKPIKTKHTNAISYLTLLVIICSVLIILFLLKNIYIYVDSEGIKRSFAQQSNYCTRGVDTMPKRSTNCYGDMSHARVAFLIVYIVLRIFYSLLFTFTVCFGVLMVFIRPDFDRLANMDQYVNKAQNQTHVMSRAYDKHWRDELLREAELVTDIQGACSFYVTELFDSMTSQMNNITSQYHQRHLYGDETSLSYLMYERYTSKLHKYHEAIETFKTEYYHEFESNITPPVKKYTDFLTLMFNNAWLAFSQRLFNESDFDSIVRRMNIDGGLVEGAAVNFGLFMELEEVEEIRLWKIQFRERYESLMPQLPRLPIPDLVMHTPHCTVRTARETYNVTSPSHQHLRSERYYTPHLPLEADKGPSFKHGVPLDTAKGPSFEHDDIVEEYKFVTDGSIPLLRKNDRFQATDDLKLSNMVDMDIVWMIFIALDVLLLIYRTSHTYMNASQLCKEHGYYVKSDRQSSRANENEYYTSPGVVTDTTTQYRQVNNTEHSIPLGAQKVNCNSNYYNNHNGNGSRYHDSHSNQRIVTKLKDRDNVSCYSNQNDTVLMAILNTGIKIVLSETLPKVLIGCTVLILCYVAMATVYVAMDMDVVIGLDLLAIYVSGLKTQINQTNWYLSDQAKYFNDVSMTIYEGQMKSELTYLETMLQYFNSEQKRQVFNYKAEACCISHDDSSNWTCHIDPAPPSLVIPLLPCNFIPISPRLLSDNEPMLHKEELLSQLEPYLVSLQSVATATLYTLLIVMATIFIIHVIGLIFFHYMKCTNRNSSTHIYVTTPLTTSCDVDDNLPPPPTEESDYESDEGFTQPRGGGVTWRNAQTLPHGRHHIAHDQGMRTYPSPRGAQPSPRGVQHVSRGMRSSADTTAMLHHCDYSETKV